MRSYARFRFVPWFICCSLLLLPCPLWAQRVVVPSFVEAVNPASSGITLQQVVFRFDAGSVSGSDWGQIQVDPAQFYRVTQQKSGYLQVFISETQRRGRGTWGVQNLYIPEALTAPCAQGQGNTSPAATSPLSMYLDLRPTREGGERLTQIFGTILLSKQPLPVSAAMRDLDDAYTPQPIKVEAVVINAEGETGDLGRIPPGPPTSGLDLLGPPPIPPDPSPTPPLDLQFPIEVFQDPLPNINAAKNQCVPMAHANVLSYLMNRYDGFPLQWYLPHPPAPGIGKIGSNGDVLFWFPEPADSIIAQIDAYTRRMGVFNPSVGDPTPRCQHIRGIFGYLTQFGELAEAVYRHQGGSEVYGDGLECDNGTVLMGGKFTVREGLHPTWPWIFDQLQMGRGVAMSFGRYNPMGERTSGHMVRVWGAARYNGKHYLYTLDDGSQGSNSWGLRTQQWEVADTGQPGLAGLPDGRLNMSNLSWEIEFAISAEAKPTLFVP